jgi:hypothetical protein
MTFASVADGTTMFRFDEELRVEALTGTDEAGVRILIDPPSQKTWFRSVPVPLSSARDATFAFEALLDPGIALNAVSTRSLPVEMSEPQASSHTVMLTAGPSEPFSFVTFNMLCSAPSGSRDTPVRIACSCACW